jgi:uncharacterized protein (TIGR03086 family)
MPDDALATRAFAGSARAMGSVVDRVDDDRWSLELPQAMRWRDSLHTLRDLIAHYARDEAWVPDVLAGATAAEVGGRYDGDLLGVDPATAYAALVERSIASVEAADDLGGLVHVSYGDLSARDYLLHVTIFRGLGAHDVAALVGVDPALPDELVRDLYELIAPHAEALRAMGVFGPEVQVPAEAPLARRLLGLTGRDSTV